MYNSKYIVSVNLLICRDSLVLYDIDHFKDSIFFLFFANIYLSSNLKSLNDYFVIFMDSTKDNFFFFLWPHIIGPQSGGPGINLCPLK